MRQAAKAGHKGVDTAHEGAVQGVDQAHQQYRQGVDQAADTAAQQARQIIMCKCAAAYISPAWRPQACRCMACCDCVPQWTQRDL